MRSKLYTEYRDGKPARFRFCAEEWEVMRFFMEGGFETEEEARLMWERENGRSVDSD